MEITLKSLPQATAQQVFDQVARHLLTQGVKSEKDGDCLYRTQGGLKCAAGCLMTDEEAHRVPEGRRWGYLAEYGYAPTEHSVLIVELQIVHDGVAVESWPSCLTAVANQFGLDASVIASKMPAALEG